MGQIVVKAAAFDVNQNGRPDDLSKVINLSYDAAIVGDFFIDNKKTTLKGLAGDLNLDVIVNLHL
jgi:hypothetical protein